ncbi:MAG: LPS export ABC transporter permease LptG [Rhizobiales bacterium]|nr:LPS export ABC transporter permease LptG [Hyphomicrobiales bacterium]
MSTRDLGPAISDRRPVRLSLTLSVYIAKHALVGVMIALVALGVIAVVVDLIELLRRASSRPEATFGVVFTMAWLHLPFFLQQLLPFAVLFGAMFSFQRLTRSHELVVARATGVSVWQFLTPALAVALGLGVLTVTVFNPVGAVLVSKYETMERLYFSYRASMVAVSQGGLWLRQQHGDGGELLLHARQMKRDPPTLGSVMVFFYDDQMHFAARADAKSARLRPGSWELIDPLYSTPDGDSQQRARLDIPTDLTPDRIKESFEAPETTSFWDLPAFIEQLEAVGFSATEHRLYWHRLLSLPCLLAAMLLIGVTFSLRLVRQGGNGILIACGLITGFAFYILSDVIFALGLSGRLPPTLAAWTPPGSRSSWA